MTCTACHENRPRGTGDESEMRVTKTVFGDVVVQQEHVHDGKFDVASWQQANRSGQKPIDDVIFKLSMDSWIESGSCEFWQAMFAFPSGNVKVKRFGGFDDEENLRERYGIDDYLSLVVSNKDAEYVRGLTKNGDPMWSQVIPFEYIGLDTQASNSFELKYFEFRRQRSDIFGPSDSLGSFRVWAILPDRIVAVQDVEVGVDRHRHQEMMEARRAAAVPRDRLPELFQVDKRIWTKVSFEPSAIPPGIHLSWSSGDLPKLVLEFRLPWQRSDEVVLPHDPFILEGLDVPSGVKEFTLLFPAMNALLEIPVVLPAYPDGKGECVGKVELDLLKLGPRLSEKSIYSVYAVSGGLLGGPLPANKAGLPPEPEFKNSGYVWEEQ
ncbi:MAG: hypothetical protein IPN71_01410 [Fibrobacteres bacterium]|nr:hypothetical protein [Fibrobacterota bacterium]